MIFLDEIYDKPAKNIYPTNNIIVRNTDDTWSLDLLDLIDYGVKNNGVYWYILVVLNNFSKYGWTVAMKNKYASTIKDAFSTVLVE